MEATSALVLQLYPLVSCLAGLESLGDQFAHFCDQTDRNPLLSTIAQFFLLEQLLLTLAEHHFLNHMSIHLIVPVLVLSHILVQLPTLRSSDLKLCPLCLARLFSLLHLYSLLAISLIFLDKVPLRLTVRAQELCQKTSNLAWPLFVFS